MRTAEGTLKELFRYGSGRIKLVVSDAEMEYLEGLGIPGSEEAWMRIVNEIGLTRVPGRGVVWTTAYGDFDIEVDNGAG